MGKNKFDKRRKRLKERRYGYKEQNANSYLIITEGTKTEPNYFNGIKKIIMEKRGGNISIQTPEIFVEGKGSSTSKLVEITDEIVKNSKIMYQNIWIVFDKDNFDDFDDAIIMAHNRDYKVAWSNESFEYFLYLHFHYSDAALHRNGWNKKLKAVFKENKINNGRYEKNIKDIYHILDTNDSSVTNAIKNAKRRYLAFDLKKMKPSDFNPGTTVHLLVEELLEYI